MVDPDAEALRHTIRVLEAIVDDRTLLMRLAEPERIALLQAAGRLSRPNRHEVQRVAKAFRRIVRKNERDADREARASTEIRAARLAEVFVPPQLRAADADAPGLGGEGQESRARSGALEVRELVTPRACYVCKESYRRLHFFYDSMCVSCAEFNYRKRFQTAPLEGRVALITGARVKIGYQAALMMLRAGARVLVTTRFPRDAARRYAGEPDFAMWRHRLQIHGLDLRHSPSVELFTQWLTDHEARLDILINNAAQTVRRPAAFYAPMLELERRDFADVPEAVRSLLTDHEACKSALSGETIVPSARPSTALGGASRESNDGSSTFAGNTNPAGIVAFRGGNPAIGIQSSAALSQLVSAYDDVARDHEHFPLGHVDADQQQVDLRTTNSWRLTLGDVPSPEMLEVQLVNAVAPFILASKLKPLMSRDRTDQKHIVNVSAMEGQFSRGTKTDKHPHTNMAKASLNMMTLTSAPDYARAGIFMNAVDTGWVTDEDPAVLAAKKRDLHDFQPPLDIVDGAARICDPFFSGLLTGEHVFGKFLKDYKPTGW